MARGNQANIHTINWATLPQPEDDGRADHLEGTIIPSIELKSTAGGALVNLSELAGLSIVFIYPMTANPDIPLPSDWDMIPGARGCTPQACAFRDLDGELKSAGADHIFGLSVQTSDYQKEAAERLHLPYPLLSDEAGKFRNALTLPVMNVEGTTLLRRLVMIITHGKIKKVWYPVFPPDQSAQTVLAWLDQ